MRRLLVAVAAGLGLLAAPAQAGLLGSTISAIHVGGAAQIYSPSSFVVGAGVETIAYFNFTTHEVWSVDFSNDGLVMTLLVSDLSVSGPAEYGPLFSIMSGGPFGQIDLVQASAGQAINASLIGGALQVDYVNTNWLIGDTITLRFSDVATVPAPAALGLFGLGLLGLAAVRRSGPAAVAA